MMRIGSFGIRTKITFVIVVEFLMGLVLAVIAWNALGSIRSDLNQTDYLEKVVERAVSMDVAAEALTAWWSGSVLTGDRRFVEQYRRGVQGMLKAFEEIRPKLSQGSRAAESLAGVERAFNSWRTSVAGPGITAR